MARWVWIEVRWKLWVESRKSLKRTCRADQLSHMHLDGFMLSSRTSETECYPGSWPWRRNRARWCRRRTPPRGAAPGLCRNWGTPLQFLEQAQRRTGVSSILYREEYNSWKCCFLTNLWGLEGAHLQLLLQLCQRGVGDQVLQQHKETTTTC